ncbi:olfactory receptor 2G3-like [Alligator mississippiensis]|uniref:olfactory receptor 2G3-like n=1 Tax=Alligator mississippiensis TaxID=8496 RepID=UPI002877DB12|nr:olfactory receptor 2G3-like [Alligator mississippiensis]
MYSKAAWGNQHKENQSTTEEFILLGMSDQPQLELLLFVLLFIGYMMTLLGNVTIIVVSRLDPRLHTPMYFFLSNLSFLDICYTTSVGPQMLVNFLSARKAISWGGCVAQLYISLGLGSTECLLLAVMAYDRYAAVCQPLRYVTIISHHRCLLMAASSWLGGLVNSLAQTVLTIQLPRCGRNHIDHIFCELPALLKLVCADTSIIENQHEGNQSTTEEFILLGVSDQPQLELLLFVLILISYMMTLLGNITIIVISRLDPRLHTPMYFFLSNLSFLDICYTTSLGPQMLVNFLSTHKSISWGGCVAQLYISLGLGATECLLLAVMALDRYAAICQPLRYMTIMSHRLCLLMAASSWFGGLVNSLAQTVLTMQLPRCGRNHIDHIFCEVPALLTLACTDTSFNEAELFSVSVMLLVVPVSLILISYGYIGAAVMRIRSSEGRHKAFSTCTSHLAVVSLFYGPAIYMYLQPPSKGQGKIASLFYTMFTPMLNPLIYTLRNKEVHGALRRLLRRKPGLTGWS